MHALGVTAIIVCGHSHCGALSALLQSAQLAELPALADWLSHAEATRRIMKEKYPHLEGPPLVTATVALQTCFSSFHFPVCAFQFVLGD